MYFDPTGVCLKLDVRQANEGSSYSLHTNFACPYLRQKFSMSLVPKPILKLLNRPVVCACVCAPAVKGLEIHIYLVCPTSTRTPVHVLSVREFRFYLSTIVNSLSLLSFDLCQRFGE
jgi:hypothetical protein